MSHYAVGSFERGKSRSPYQFVCKRVYPEGPFALLDTKLRRTSSPETSTVYLFELEDWHSIDQRSQFVTKIIVPLHEVRSVACEALKGVEWEMVTVRGHRQIQIVGGVLKTEYGYFKPQYDNGFRSNGMDEDPRIWFRACEVSSENPYGEVLGTALAQSYLICENPEELERAHNAGITTASLGDSVQEKTAD